jgi:hypothetical protein
MRRAARRTRRERLRTLAAAWDAFSTAVLDDSELVGAGVRGVGWRPDPPRLIIYLNASAKVDALPRSYDTFPVEIELIESLR